MLLNFKQLVMYLLFNLCN